MNKRKLIIFLLFMIFCISNTMAQNTITGKVTGDDGQPVIGASVAVKGTTIGTISDVDGSFTLHVPQGNMNDTIQFSYIGMETIAEPIAGRSSISVVMHDNDVSMDEVVVTALGLSKDRKAIGYSALQVSGEELVSSKTTNPMAALSGKVAGVEIIGNAGPGSSQNVMIRGASSLSQNQPLYIVDGVPLINRITNTGDGLNYATDMGTGLNAVNPNDIEAMTVLKGAAATALYGSRAANGVILITTKSGKNTNGKMNISYDGTLTLQRVGMLPRVQEKYGEGWYGIFSTVENGNWGPAYTGTPQAWGYVYENQRQVANYEFLPTRLRDFYETGIANSHTVAASGGNASTNYYVSLSNDHENGVLPLDYDTYNRTTFATRASHKWNKFTFSSSFNVATEKVHQVPAGQSRSLGQNLFNSALHISLVDLKDEDNPFNSNDYFFTPYGQNPYWCIRNMAAELHRNKIYGKFQADYQIYKDLKFTYRFGGDVENTKTESMRNLFTFTPGSPQYVDNNNTVVDDSGYYKLEKATEYEINNDAFLTYTKNITEDLGVSAIAGFSAMETSWNYLNGEIQSLVLPGFYNLTNSTAEPTTTTKLEKIRRIGLFANVDFDYKRMVYLTLTARNDWSSTLPTNNNSYAYPGITLSWIFTELGDEGKLGPLTFGKLRAAYGWTGKDASVYTIYDFYAPTTIVNPGYPDVNDFQFPANGVNSWSVSNQMGNPELKPERTNEFELGTELIFYNGRFGIDASYYNKYTKDLINRLSLDVSTGYTSTFANIGDVRNKGYEISLFGYPVKTKDFSWKLSANVAQNKNKVEKLMLDEILLEGFSTCAIYAVEGQSVGQFKTTQALTVENGGKSYVVVDAKGCPVETDNEYIGRDINEKIRVGLTSAWQYKNFGLEATLDLHMGGYMFSNTKHNMGWTGSGYETTLNDRNPFIIPNSVLEVNAGTKGAIEVEMPDHSKKYYVENTTAPLAANNGKTGALHTFYSNGGLNCGADDVIERSYMKLRNASFYYTLPGSIAAKLKLQDVRFSFNAGNILLWLPKSNGYVDPESTSYGTGIGAKFGETNTNPTNQIYTFGVSVKF